MNILLVGGQQDADNIIKTLRTDGHEVIYVDKNRSRCQCLADKYEMETICGDASDPDILRIAHAERMNTVISLCDRDSDNFIICDLAKRQFHVKHTYTIATNPKNVELFQEFGVDRCLNTARSFSELIEQQAVEGNIKKYLPDKDGHIIITDVVLSKNAPSVNKKLWELGFPPHSIIACIIREDEKIIPQGNTILMAGDKVIIISNKESMDETIMLLNGKK